MPKPMLKRDTENKAETLLSATYQAPKTDASKMDQMKLDRLLRAKRSQKYMDAVTKLDAGGHTCNEHKVAEIIDAIKAEFPEVELAGVLLGIVSICYLGVPYEVHTLDMTGSIIHHYQKGEPMPGNMEKARGIAMRGGYSFIEVYANCCRAVSSNGSVSVINF